MHNLLLLPQEEVGYVPSFAESCPGGLVSVWFDLGSLQGAGILWMLGGTENKGSEKEPAIPQTPDGIRD